ncbi:Metallo-dependent phosphatase-like protein [Mycena pura]|uniref:Metallo-dependent phosphatase-like protein n=1 Tax=Mycena pura TaxID=153505 RepID=A0AAD6Y833_9AGAR|nr:Metallo-dependent phosphatase-like protein [Mycena pura]
MPALALPHRTCISSPTSVVQLEYPPASGPLPKPDAANDAAQWTRFVLLSDTHTRTCAVPDGDVLVHTGDLTQMGRLRELRTTMEWLYSLPHRVKIVIAGNHDCAVHREYYEAAWKDSLFYRPTDEPESAEKIQELLKGPAAVAANITYLESEEYRFRVRDGGREWSVYGSPWSPNFGDWAFGYEREDGAALVSKFPQTDILLTHGPPRNILDLTNRGVLAGCAALSARVEELRPRLHVFGHIHEARGAYLHRWRRDRKPSAQNAIQLTGYKRTDADAPAKKAASPNDGDDDEEWFDVEESDVDSDLDDGLSFEFDGDAEETAPGREDQETLFVNAANWPSGPNARRTGMRPKMGENGFQPVVVDLLE